MLAICQCNDLHDDICAVAKGPPFLPVAPATVAVAEQLETEFQRTFHFTNVVNDILFSNSFPAFKTFPCHSWGTDLQVGWRFVCTGVIRTQSILCTLRLHELLVGVGFNRPNCALDLDKVSKFPQDSVKIDKVIAGVAAFDFCTT